MANLLINNCSIFNGVSPQIQADSWIEIQDGLIHRIASGPPPKIENSIDLSGKTIIPGLINNHVHLLIDFSSITDLSGLFYRMDQFKRNMALCISNGITTVRDVGGTPGLLDKLIKLVESEKAIGPRIIRTNAFISPTDGYPDFIPSFPFPLNLLMGGQAVERNSDPEQVRNAVRRVVAQGADWIKTSYVDKPFFVGRQVPPLFSDEGYRALMDEARIQNKPVAMHHFHASGLRKGMELGVSSMEHSSFDPLSEEDVMKMKESKIFIVPTLTVFRDLTDIKRTEMILEKEGEKYLIPKPLKFTKQVVSNLQKVTSPEMAQNDFIPDLEMIKKSYPVMVENTRRLHEAGVNIGCGTDSGGSGIAIYGRFFEEIECLMDAGMTNFEALRCATYDNARLLKMEDKIGSIETGKIADLAVVEGNPLEDIKALRNVNLVVKGGKVIWQNNHQ